MWILPSRARAHNVQRFFDLYAKTNASTPGVLALCDDDPDLRIYKRLALPAGWKLSVYPRMWMIPKVNQVFDDNPGKDWYGMIDDDAVPVTDGWDMKLVKASGKGISYCHNGIGNERLASQFVINGDLARKMGCVMLRGLNRLYGDNYITDLGQKLNCLTYLPDVSVEQWHFSNGKAPYDKTYEKPESVTDREVYERWRNSFMNDPVTMVCLKAGKQYGPEYVNILFDMVRRNLPEGFPGRFVCLTDDATGLDKGIETIRLPSDLERWWGKLYLFKRGLFQPGTRLVYMDLDTVITGSLEKLFTYKGQFATLRDFYHDRLGPAIIAWKDGAFSNSVWAEWDAKGRPRNELGDLWWLNQLNQGRFHKEIDILQDLFPGDFVSFKKDCSPYFRPGTKVVCFHGEPRPHNCQVDWVQKTWKMGGMSAGLLQAISNTETRKIVENVRSCMKRGLTELPMVQAHSGQAVLVGGGPSLKAKLAELRWRASLGQTIFALNGAGKYLIECGITPQHVVILDARPENIAFITPIHTFLASHCHPSLFDAAQRATVYHVNTEGVAEVLEDEAILISTGSTVGLVAIGIAHVLGFRKFHLYGYDSSYKTDHHAYEQKWNDSDAVIDATVGTRTFKSAPWMVHQVQQFQNLASQLIATDCIITVAGDGLLPHVARSMMNIEEAA